MNINESYSLRRQRTYDALGKVGRFGCGGGKGYGTQRFLIFHCLGEKPIYLKDLGVIGVATNREHVYVCACCGHILFEKDHIIHEEDGYGDELNRFVLFPMKWMAAKERRELQEKEEGDEGSKEDLDDEENVQVLEAFMADLFCPNADCGKKVGRYCWLGRNCICEQSFNPSFEVEYLAVRNLAS